MGAQQYLIKNQENYYDKALKTMVKSADRYFLKKKFLIGEGVDEDKLRHAQLLEEILCTDSCELINYIHKKIKGELEPTNKKSRKPIKPNFQDDDYTIVINNFNTSQIWEDVKW